MKNSHVPPMTQIALRLLPCLAFLASAAPAFATPRPNSLNTVDRTLVSHWQDIQLVRPGGPSIEPPGCACAKCQEIIDRANG